MLLNLFKPVLNACESHLLSHVIYQQDAHGSLVVSLGDCSEPLLACRIPYLQLHHFVVAVYYFYSEVNPDSRHVRGRKLVVREPQQQARLSHR